MCYATTSNQILRSPPLEPPVHTLQHRRQVIPPLRRKLFKELLGRRAGLDAPPETLDHTTPLRLVAEFYKGARRDEDAVPFLYDDGGRRDD